MQWLKVNIRACPAMMNNLNLKVGHVGNQMKGERLLIINNLKDKIQNTLELGRKFRRGNNLNLKKSLHLGVCKA
jgi:hypothetical protein